MSKSEKSVLSVFAIVIILLVGMITAVSLIGTVSFVDEQSAAVTYDEAKSIALTDSGQQDNTAIVFTAQKLKYNKGIQVYEIDFHDSMFVYKYKVNATDGSIVSKSVKPLDFD